MVNLGSFKKPIQTIENQSLKLKKSYT